MNPSSLSELSVQKRVTEVADVVSTWTPVAPGNFVIIATVDVHAPVTCSVSVRARTSYSSPSSLEEKIVEMVPLTSPSLATTASAKPVAEEPHDDCPVSLIWKR
jgi:hypothetical protein